VKRILLLSCCLVAAASTAELAVRDIHLGLVNRPGDFDFDLKTSTVDISGSDAFDGGLSLEGGARWSFSRTGDSIGLIAGADIAVDRQSYDGGDGLTTLWGRAALGVGWAITDRLTLIGEGLAGFGLSSLKLPASQVAEEFTATGTAIDYEARVSATWQFTRDFGAGVIGGWMVASHDLSGDDTDITLDQNGWYVGLSAVWRMDDAPPGLE
jgi:hypothetical protein